MLQRVEFRCWNKKKIGDLEFTCELCPGQRVMLEGET